MLTVPGDCFYLAELLTPHHWRWEQFIRLEDAKAWCRAVEAPAGLPGGVSGRVWRVSVDAFTGALVTEEVFELVSAETVGTV